MSARLSSSSFHSLAAILSGETTQRAKSEIGIINGSEVKLESVRV
jgi:hypothetical protein